MKMAILGGPEHMDVKMTISTANFRSVADKPFQPRHLLFPPRSFWKTIAKKGIPPLRNISRDLPQTHRLSCNLSNQMDSMCNILAECAEQLPDTSWCLDRSTGRTPGQQELGWLGLKHKCHIRLPAWSITGFTYAETQWQDRQRVKCWWSRHMKFSNLSVSQNSSSYFTNR